MLTRLARLFPMCVSSCCVKPAVATFRSQPGYTAVLRLVAPMARTSARLKHWSYFVSTLSSTLSGLFTLSSTFRNSVLHPFWQPCSSASKLRFTVCSSGCVQIDMKRPVLIKLKVVEHHATISIHHQLCLRCNWSPKERMVAAPLESLGPHSQLYHGYPQPRSSWSELPSVLDKKTMHWRCINWINWSSTWVIRGYLGLLSSLPTGVWLGLKRNSASGMSGLDEPIFDVRELRRGIVICLRVYLFYFYSCVYSCTDLYCSSQRQFIGESPNSPSVCRVADLKNPHRGMAWHMQRAVRLPVILSPLGIIRRTIQMSESELSRCLFSYGVFEQCLQKLRARKYWPSHLALS